MARRSYGTGNLRVRRGASYGQWWIGDRHVQRKLGPKREPGSRRGLTQQQAERELQRHIEAAEARNPTDAPTIEEAGARLVQSLEAHGRKASTLATYESTIKVHLAPHFGESSVHQITTEDVEAFISSCQAKACAPKSIRNYLGALHAILDFAKVRPNPVTDARKPEAPESDPDIRFLTEVELEALLRAVPDDHLGSTDHALYLTAALTGLRQGELFALRWRDVDWTASRIRVRRSFAHKRAGREAQLGKPRSKRSSRSVPMHDRVGAELERHFQRSGYQADDDLVFCHPQPADRSTGRTCSIASAISSMPPAFGGSPSTICATPSAPAWPPLASRCAPCRSGWATATSRPR